MYPHAGSRITYEDDPVKTVYRLGPMGLLSKRKGITMAGGITRTVYGLPFNTTGCQDNHKEGGDAMPTGEGTTCDTVETCQSWCSKMPLCRAYMYNLKTGMCSLSYRRQLEFAPAAQEEWVSRAKCIGNFSDIP